MIVFNIVCYKIVINKGMRFEFCGNVSCPEWFIAQISVLTKITAIKMKLIFTQLISYYLQNQDISSKIVKLLSGTGLDIYQMNAVISTLNFILYNSIQSHVTDSVLNKELIDLGLPKENVESITKTYKTNRDKLLERSLDKIPKLTSNVDIEYSIHDFLGSYRLSSQSLTPVRFAEINLTHRDANQMTKSYDFVAAEDELQNLIYELEQALSIVDKMEAPK